jgi:hypothetical protein
MCLVKTMVKIEVEQKVAYCVSLKIVAQFNVMI